MRLGRVGFRRVDFRARNGHVAPTCRWLRHVGGREASVLDCLERDSRVASAARGEGHAPNRQRSHRRSAPSRDHRNRQPNPREPARGSPGAQLTQVHRVDRRSAPGPPCRASRQPRRAARRVAPWPRSSSPAGVSKTSKSSTPPTQRRLLEKIRDFSQAPLAHAIKLTDPRIGTYRYRVGDFRVVFDLEDDTVFVLRVGHRREIYA
ncbi:MAG: type II toxin-antitoxin system RelE/ParE family toxin [Thermoanaerobaculia bacterium]|nr:type II toxin-antitoxin system RelE/ParE family toxin [Thermoanaerobaculia bacterium]